MKSLTPREINVLQLIGQGYSSQQIAQELLISAHTVDSHRKNLLTKFDAKNAAELILRAFQAKVLNTSNYNEKLNTNDHEHVSKTPQRYDAA